MADISGFWNWFSKNCQDFGSSFDNIDLLHELDTKINELGKKLAWEVGPGKNADKALVISPGGNVELLPYTKAIVMQAKGCTGWEYYYAKPPKQWELIFEFKTTSNQQAYIDASNWRYVLLQYEDGMFEIIIKAANIEALSNGDKLIAVEILLDGVIGEELRITTICFIDIVREFEEAHRDKVSDIKNLLSHMNSLHKRNDA